MFENILLRGSDSSDGVLDAGLLAEALLFYQNVHAVLNRGSLASLLRVVKPDGLNHLIDNGFLKVTFQLDGLGTTTKTEGGVTVHDFVAFEFKGFDKGGKRIDENTIDNVFFRTLGRSGKSKRAAKRFRQKVKKLHLNELAPDSLQVTAIAREDLADTDYVRAAADIVISETLPHVALPEGWRFRPVWTEAGSS